MSREEGGNRGGIESGVPRGIGGNRGNRGESSTVSRGESGGIGGIKGNRAWCPEGNRGNRSGKEGESGESARVPRGIEGNRGESGEWSLVSRGESEGGNRPCPEGNRPFRGELTTPAAPVDRASGAACRGYFKTKLKLFTTLRGLAKSQKSFYLRTQKESEAHIHRIRSTDEYSWLQQNWWGAPPPHPKISDVRFERSVVQRHD